MSRRVCLNTVSSRSTRRTCGDAAAGLQGAGSASALRRIKPPFMVGDVTGFEANIGVGMAGLVEHLVRSTTTSLTGDTMAVDCG